MAYINKDTNTENPEANALISTGSSLLKEFNALPKDAPNREALKASLSAVSNSLAKFLNNPATAKIASELIGAIQQAVGASAADIKDLTNIIADLANQLKNASPEQIKAIQNQLASLAANPRFQAAECIDIIERAQLRVLTMLEQAPARAAAAQNIAGGFVQSTLAQAGLSFLAASNAASQPEIADAKNIS